MADAILTALARLAVRVMQTAGRIAYWIFDPWMPVEDTRRDRMVRRHRIRCRRAQP